MLEHLLCSQGIKTLVQQTTASSWSRARDFRYRLNFFSKKKSNFLTHFENHLVHFVASKVGPKGERKGGGSFMSLVGFLDWSVIQNTTICNQLIQSVRRTFLRITKLIDNFITRKTFYVCCWQKVLLRGRTTASLKICLRGQVFVRVETTRSHLAWSTDDRNLTFFWGIKTNLS